jgi:hypothetical protein
MMKPPKNQNNEENTDPVPLSEAEMKAMTDFYSFYENRDLAQIMIDHDFLPPTPKDKEGNKQWQIDEMALRLEYCKATRINIVFANKLNKIQNSYSPPADVHSMYFGQKHPRAEFELIESSNTVCKLRCRLHPGMAWIPVTFDIVDAQDQKLIKEKSVHWKGNGIQNMLAKNCRIKAENILDRSFVGNTPVEYSEEENPSTQKIEEEVKTQIVSFSKPESPKPFTPPISVEPEPIKEEVYEIAEIVEPVNEPINTSPITPEEIKEIRDQKISELPPSANDPIEVLEPVNMLAREEVLEPEPQEEESKRKTKKTSKKSIKDITEKPDTSFLNKDPLKEIPMKELKKPFGMSQLTINDPKFHNEITYNRIGDDWYRSLTIQEFMELAAIDMNITAFQTVLQQVYPDLLPKIDAQFQILLKETNESEKLAVLYHDALSMIENPPELSIVDLKYMELMEKMILGLEKLAIILKKEQPENPLEFIMKASQGKWTNKEAVWGYKYIQARGLI